MPGRCFSESRKDLRWDPVRAPTGAFQRDQSPNANIRKGQVAAVRPRSGMEVHVRRSSEGGILRVRWFRPVIRRLERLLERVPVAVFLHLPVVLPDRLDVLPATLGGEVLDVALPVRRAGPAEDARGDVLREARAFAGPPEDLERPSPVERLALVRLEEESLRLVRRNVAAQDRDRVPRD